MSASTTYHQPLFNDELNVLLKHLQSASPDESAGFLSQLTALFRELANPEVTAEAESWYLPHRIVLALADGSPTALNQARGDFLREWRHGAELGRGDVHWWNSRGFLSSDRWIAGAMAAQLLILFDWLAAREVWTEVEIDEIADEALAAMEGSIMPHLRGRGTFPVAHAPINQNNAMAAGLLIAGYMFGYKWRGRQEARRLFGFAKLLYGDLLGQFLTEGYDGDGMTYMRLIHPSCFVLMAALLEETTGEDWYFRRFQPGGHSLAATLARQLDLITPGGWSWPLGRYGYIRQWNCFMLSFAARRSGDPRYLIALKRDLSECRFNTPWLGMDLPLALLWYPEKIDHRVAEETWPEPESWCQADAWAALYADDALAGLVWHAGKMPTFFLEADKQQVIFSGGETWDNCNCVQPPPNERIDSDWLAGGGRPHWFARLPSLSGVMVETGANYPATAGVESATRGALMINGFGLFMRDQIAAATSKAWTWQALTRADSRIEGRTAVIGSASYPPARILFRQGEASLDQKAGRIVYLEGAKNAPQTAMLENSVRGRNPKFDVWVSWAKDSVSIKDTDSAEPDETRALSIAADSRQCLILPPRPENGAMRQLGELTTDAAAAVTHDTAVCLLATRQCRGPVYTWSSSPVDIEIGCEQVVVDRLGYGDFLSLRCEDGDLLLRVGNGLEVWRCGFPRHALRIGGRFDPVVVDGVEVSARHDGDWTVLGQMPDHAGHRPDIEEAIQKLQAVEELDQHDKTQLQRVIQLVQTVKRRGCRTAVPALCRLIMLCLEDGLGDKDDRAQALTEAAHALGVIGDQSTIPVLLDVLRQTRPMEESGRTRPWSEQWWLSGPRVALCDALLLLEGREVLEELRATRDGEMNPHMQSMSQRVEKVFAATTN